MSSISNRKSNTHLIPPCPQIASTNINNNASDRTWLTGERHRLFGGSTDITPSATPSPDFLSHQSTNYPDIAPTFDSDDSGHQNNFNTPPSHDGSNSDTQNGPIQCEEFKCEELRYRSMTKKTQTIFSSDSGREWHGLAQENQPKNHALVIIQGFLEPMYQEKLNRCLFEMGFIHPRIIYKPHGKILQDEVEQESAKLVEGLSPGSNLLLIICEGDYGGIELKQDFLDNKIYQPVAQYNRSQHQKFHTSHIKAKIDEFDARLYEGVTLHVLLDGVDGRPLKHLLQLDLPKSQQDIMRSKWKDHVDNANNAILKGPMGQGDIIQFWLRRGACGYKRFLLLRAMIIISLEEPELPYFILILRLQTILHKTLEQTPSSAQFNYTQHRSSERSAEMIALPVCKSLIELLVKYIQSRTAENRKDQYKQNLFNGTYVFSSVDKFDPHLSLKFNWM
eukprot:g2828.t1